MDRREFLKFASLLSMAPQMLARAVLAKGGAWVNDVHSRLNRTHVAELVTPTTENAIQDAIAGASAAGRAVSLAGGRHAMGGQQFGTETTLLDLTDCSRVGGLDSERGILEVESGAQWPAVIRYLVDTQNGQTRQWGIAQKQTGTDRLTIGGALAANAHGRGLNMSPMISDVESFTLIGPDGEKKTCSRNENQDLFALAIGGYGLFGVMSTVRLRLAPRRKVERVVEIINIDDLPAAFEQRRVDGYLYGDCQYAIDEKSPDYIRRGVFSCYRPVAADTPIPEKQLALSDQAWRELIYLAHVNKSAAFERYSRYYMSTNGQIYWSDLHQLSSYLDDYHTALNRRRQTARDASEIITEVYVPLPALADFLEEVRGDFRRHKVNVIYGTIRLIRQDRESFLPWAREDYVSIIFNLHTKHSGPGIEKSAQAFRRLIDMAIRRGGSYFLTYHRFARRDQVTTCYPRFIEFLRRKRQHDPDEVFQSDWYRHYRRMFADQL